MSPDGTTPLVPGCWGHHTEGTPMTSILRTARAVAAATPHDRLRSIDFIRAASMVVVVAGHWLMAIIWLDGTTPRFGHALADAPWTQWLTWAVQVMPLFFLAGGFSNGRSLAAAHRSGTSTWAWIGARIRRLMAPTVPLVVVWAALAAIAGGIDPTITRAATTAALVPLWFLAVYLVVVLLAPLTLGLHARIGMRAVAVGVALAAAVDLLRFGAGWEWIGWANFAFIWLTIHQVGYGWDRRPGPRAGLAIAAFGLVALAGLVAFGPYPVSMVGVPGEGLTNTTPPTFPLLALAAFQAGLLAAATPRLERWLGRRGPWTAVVALGGSVMGLYVWHMTAMAIGTLAFLALGGGILVLEPLTTTWWLARPVWFATLGAIVLGLVAATHRFERAGGSGIEHPARLVVGTIAMCAALAEVLLDGFVTAAGAPRLGATAIFVGGAALAGALPLRTPARPPSGSRPSGS